MLIKAVTGLEVTFAEDNAPTHRVHENQLLTHKTPDIIAATTWPANSPDLSPVDYRIWGKL